MGMFDLYPKTETPDNRPKCPRHFHLDIMTGENASHSFEVPHRVLENSSKIEVIYKLGIEVKLVKEVAPEDIDDNDNVVTVKLSPEDTELFAKTLLTTNVQLKFTMDDGSTLFSEIYRVNVTDSLEV